MSDINVTLGDDDVSVALGTDDISVALDSAAVAVDVSTLYSDALALAAVNSSTISPPSVETETLSGGVTDNQPLTKLDGDNLTIDAGVLNAASGGGTTDVVDVSDDGTPVVADVADINFGANASVTDDQDGTVTVDTIDTDTNTQLTDEQVQDIVGAFILGANATTVTYDDASNTLTISSTDTNTQRTDEQIQDVVGGFVSGSGATSVTYDDATGSLTIDSTDTDTDTHTAVSDDGIQTLADVSDVNFSTDLSVVDDGDGSVTVASTASGGTSSDADTLDGLHRSEFAANRRTFPIETTAGADDRIKIGTISDGGPDEAGKATVTVISPTGTETNFSSTLKMNVGVDDSQFGISHYYYGITAADAADNVGLVVTETAGTGQNGNNEYHLYIDPATQTDCLVVVEYTKFGPFDYQEALTTADYAGSPVYETIPEPPSMDAGFGEVDTESLSGGVTGGTDVTTLAGDNLSIENNELTVSEFVSPPENLLTRAGTATGEMAVHDGTDGTTAYDFQIAVWDGTNWIGMIEDGTLT